jgi:hypothetical protein
MDELAFQRGDWSNIAQRGRIARSDAPLQRVPTVAGGSISRPDINKKEVSGAVNALDIHFLIDDQVDDGQIAEVADMGGAHAPAMHVVNPKSSKPVFAWHGLIGLQGDVQPKIRSQKTAVQRICVLAGHGGVELLLQRGKKVSGIHGKIIGEAVPHSNSNWQMAKNRQMAISKKLGKIDEETQRR